MIARFVEIVAVSARYPAKRGMNRKIISSRSPKSVFLHGLDPKRALTLARLRLSIWCSSGGAMPERTISERLQFAIGMGGGLLASSPFLLAAGGMAGRTSGEEWMMAIGAAVGLSVGVALWRFIPKGLRIAFFTGVIVFGALGVGRSLEGLNRFTEAQPVKEFRTFVVDRQTSKSRGGYTYHTVRFAPVEWSKAPQPIDDEELYDRLKIGDPICGDLHTGMLGWRWWVLRPCSDGASNL